MKKLIEAQLKPLSNEIELEPFGLTTGMDGVRPVMLFREKGGEAVLPVWLSPLDAGIALTQHQPQAFMLSPHDITLTIMTKLGLKPETCHFREVKGHHQYVEIFFKGSRKLKTLKARADHAISFCMQAKVKFYCTRGFLEECRQVNAQMAQPPKGARLSDLKRNRQQYMN
jgi:hypothetical protein